MKRKIAAYTLCTLLVATCFGAGAFAQTVTFQSNMGGSARYGLVSDTMLYSLMGSRLYIADISNISTPVELASIALPGIARRIAQSGTVLYISCTTGGLVAVDVADPAHPHILSVTTFDKSDAIGQTFGVAVKGQYVYGADYSGVFVLDMTDPAAPVKVGEFTAFAKEHHNAYDAHITDSTLFISCELDGLYIFDISNPATPVKISHFVDSSQALGQFYGSLRDGNYLYVAAGGTGLAILDISNLEDPKPVSILDNNYQGVLGVAMSGGYLYLCSEFKDFYKIDVSDPENPVQVAQFLVGDEHSLGISATGDYVVLANSNYGIRIFDSRAASIRQVGEFLSLGRVIDCKGAGNFAYAAVGYKGLAVIDVFNPTLPVQVAQKTLGGYANGIAVADSFVYVAQTSHAGKAGGLLEIVDVADPIRPVILGSVALGGQPYSVKVQGNLAVVACLNDGIAVVDVSDPFAPELLGMFNTFGICYAAEIWGDYVFVADGLKGFAILDIKEPAYIKKIAGGYALGNVFDIALWDTWLYLPVSDALHIASFNPLYQPSISAATIEPVTARNREGQLKAATAFDGYLLVADSVGGARLFSISEPNNPQELSSDTYIAGDPVWMRYNVEQGLAYIPSQIAGLYIYAVDLPEKPVFNADGVWTGAGLASQSAAGIVADLYQGHADVSGTMTLYGSTAPVGLVTATIDDEGHLTGTILFDDSTSGVLDFVKSGSRLNGSITGSHEITGISLELVTARGLLSYNNCAAAMSSALASAHEAAQRLEKRQLARAEVMMTAARARQDLDWQFTLSAMAAAMIPPGSVAGSLAASEDLLYQSALWESSIMQTQAEFMAEIICPDYQRVLQWIVRQGGRKLENARSAGLQGQLESALLSLGRAANHYERAFNYYRKNVVNCPVWGAAEFSGYYEGVINFGFIAAAFKVCAEQDEAGVVSGLVRIEIEASNEFMNGWIADEDDVLIDEYVDDVARNVTIDDISSLNGTILVPFGEVTAHLYIQDWKYDIVTGQWAGKLEVLEQSVTGTVQLKKISDICPEGFPGE